MVGCTEFVRPTKAFVLTPEVSTGQSQWRKLFNAPAIAVCGLLGQVTNNLGL